MLWPVVAGVILRDIEGGLLGDLLVLSDPLHADHVSLHLRALPHQHVEGPRHVEGVAQGQPHRARVDGAAAEDREERREHQHQVPDKLESHGEPARGHVARVVADLVCVNPDLILQDEIIISPVRPE